MDYRFDTFLSYSSRDSEFTERLKDRLVEKKVKVWLDKEQIRPGDLFLSALEDGLEESQSVCIIISRDSLESGWVKEEYSRALSLSVKKDCQRRVIPVLYKDAELPGFLSNRQWVDFRKEAAFAESLQRLIWGITGKEDSLLSPEGPGKLNELIAGAQSSITISGHTLDKFSQNRELRSALIAKLNEGVKITFILLNPYSNYAKAHEPFHELESRSSALSQITNTIEMLKHILDSTSHPDKLFVLLSNYMPRFRTILVDDRFCLVNLYMYNNDVDEVPEFIFDRASDGNNQRWFRSVSKSITDLMESNHVMPVIEHGLYREYWQNIKVAHVLSHCLETNCCRVKSNNCWSDLQRVVLGYQNNDRGLSVTGKGIVGQDYRPGTFTLDRIGLNALFLEKPESFDGWATEVISAELELIRGYNPYFFQSVPLSQVAEKLKNILSFYPLNGKALKEEIFYQEYSDILHRLAMTLISNYPDFEINMFPGLTSEKKDFIFHVIEWIEKYEAPRLMDWLHLSIASGLLGIDEKPVNAATSSINHARAISLKNMDFSSDRNIQKIARTLMQAANAGGGIDSGEFFFHLMDTNNLYPLKIVSFPDDYMETLFLMKFYDELLKKYPKVEIDFIPRSIRCSNDASYLDVLDFVGRFPTLSYEYNNRLRFRINKNGPRLGGVNLLKIHPEVVEIIKNAFIVDVRGARNYEMMQGINKQTFFGFAVCRDFSVSTTGLFPDNAPLAYIHQTPRQLSFKGFTERNQRVKANNGKNYFLSTTTVMDNPMKWSGGHLSLKNSWNTELQKRFKILSRFYSSNAIEFDKKWGEHLETEVVNSLNKLSGRVLVLGCGSGKEVNYLYDRGCDVYGIDFSSEAILLAKADHPKIEDRVFVEDIYNIRNIMEGEFDAVVANASLLHLLDRDDMPGILKGIHSRLKPRGRFFLRLIKKYGDTRIEPGELERILGRNTGILLPYAQNKLLENGREEVRFNISEVKEFARAYRDNGNKLLKKAVEELLKVTPTLESEIDDREQGCLRWFVYYTEEYMNDAVSDLFTVNNFEIKDHMTVPTVKWLSYLFQKK